MGFLKMGISPHFFVLTLFYFISYSQGAFNDPQLGPIDGLDGVVIVPGQIPIIQINEEMDASQNTRIAEINVTDPSVAPTKGLVNDQIWRYFDIESDLEEQKHFLILIGRMDAEGPEGADRMSFGMVHQSDIKTSGVDVININDHDPTFNLESNQIRIREKCTEPTGCLIDDAREVEFEILTLRGVDNDRTPGGNQLEFIIEEIQPSNVYYEFTQTPTGEENEISIRLLSEEGLDYEISTIHRLRLTVTDGERETSQILTINVEDEPDMPPVFRSLPLFRSVDENSDISEPILKLEAVDGDTGIQDKILYEILEVNGEPHTEEYFRLDQESGELFFTQIMDADTLELTEFLIKIRAFEENPPNLDVVETITVSVQDTNDNFPLFIDEDGEGVNEIQFPFDIREGDCENIVPECFTGTSIFSFTVEDKDRTVQNSRYSVEISTDPGAEFVTEFLTVAQISGVGSGRTEYDLRIIKQIDFEDSDWQNPVLFKIIVTEVNENTDEKFQSFGDVTGIIEDINDHFPIFQDVNEDREYEVEVFENVEIGTEILIISATDLDISEEFGSGSIIYKWSPNSRLPPLNIDPENGSVTVSKENAFDFETIAEELFTVEAIDLNGEGNRASTLLRIRVKDVNDESPILRSPSRISIEENVEPMDLDIEITGSDIDTDADLLFSIHFENEPDPDVHDWFTWRQETIEGDHTGHQIRGFLGIGSNPPDREHRERVEVTLRVTDQNALNPGEQFMDLLLIVEILDVNDEFPDFVDAYENITYNIVETQEIEEGGPDPENEFFREIYTFRARDPDSPANTDLKFSISSIYPNMEDLVELVQGDGEERAILRRREFMRVDREYQGFYGTDTNFLLYNLTISDGVNEKYVPIEILVVDENDNEPVWVSESLCKWYSIKENTNVSEIISHPACIATDKDDPIKNGKVSYIFLEDNDLFQIDQDNGIISTIDGADIDREKFAEHTLIVRAIDNYRPSTSTGSNWDDLTVQIVILDLNDNKPRFLTESTPENPLNTVEEDFPEEGYVFPNAILVFDDDEPDTGNSFIDAELIEVTCQGCTENDPDELFGLFSLEVEWGDETLINIIANDSFVGKYGRYSLKIRAFDSPDDEDEEAHEETRDYHITIVDKNDNGPIFSYPPGPGEFWAVPKTHTVGIPLENKDNEPIPAIVATDLDDPSTGNGQITLTLEDVEEEVEGDLVNEYFEIVKTPGSNSAGLLQLKQSLLDLEDRNNFYIKLVATDGGNPSERNETIMRIGLANEFNQEPFFDLEIREVEISFWENETNSNFYDLPLATDNDFESGNNVTGDVINYFIMEHETTSHHLFTLVEKPGEFRETWVLTPRGQLNREEQDYHSIVIYTTNGDTTPSTPDRESPQFFFIDIIVLDVIDEPPYFSPSDMIGGFISGGILSTHTYGDTVKTLVGYDFDLDDTLRYEISSDIEWSDPSLNVPTIFTLNPDTGALVIEFTPQSSMKGYYTFAVTIYDSEEFSATANCRFYIVQEAVNNVDFPFSEGLEEVQNSSSLIAETLTNVFQSKSPDIIRCNIDRIESDISSPSQRTVVKTHFINTLNTPITSSVILDMLFTDPEFLDHLIKSLDNIGFNYQSEVGQRPGSSEEDSELLTYALIGGVSVLGVLLIILCVVAYFKTSSLQRKVRALTASAFGSQTDMNAIKTELPNTNVHALEGSNPMWKVEAEGGRNFQAFDAESVGSGGSVLIGVEDDEDFKNYSNEKDVDNFGGGARQNPLFMNEEAEESEGNSNKQGSDEEGSYAEDFHVAPIVRRNPLTLMRLDEDQEDEDEDTDI